MRCGEDHAKNEIVLVLKETAKVKNNKLIAETYMLMHDLI